MNTPSIKKLMSQFNLKLPLVQGGMVWVSGANLASACAQSGIVGTIGAGSMSLEVLETQISKAKLKLNQNEWKRLAVNFPLLYSKIDEQIDLALKLGVEIFITSAGSPKKYTSYLKSRGKTVMHVCASPTLAKKCEDAGVDYIIAEGFEAGGHNGKDEITTLSLIPQVIEKVKTPVIAAGGFATGASMVAGLSLGACGIQMGTRFVCTQESRAHENFKQAVIKANEASTRLLMKKHVPVRLLENQFQKEIIELENQCASRDKLIEFLGKGRAKAGMHLGDLDSGELEIGQVSGLINNSLKVQDLVNLLQDEVKITLNNLNSVSALF